MKLKTSKHKLNIPLTHMADIAYLLLIFIIIFSLINIDRRSQDLLPVSIAGDKTKDSSHLLLIVEKGFHFNDVFFADFTSLTTGLRQVDKNKPVTIIAANQTEFGRIKSVLAMLKKQGFQIIDFLVKKEQT